MWWYPNIDSKNYSTGEKIGLLKKWDLPGVHDWTTFETKSFKIKVILTMVDFRTAKYSNCNEWIIAYKYSRNDCWIIRLKAIQGK